jgi:hypothetical protein
LRQLPIAFEGFCSLRDIEAENKSVNENEIRLNISDLKKKLRVFYLFIYYLIFNVKYKFLYIIYYYFFSKVILHMM